MAARSRTVVSKETDHQGFSKVTDPVELHRLLVRAIETTSQVEVRLPSQNITFRSLILECSALDKGFQIEAPPEIKDETLKTQPGEAMLIAFMRGQNLLCVHSKNTVWNERILTVSPPWSIFKLQRRKEPRHQIPAAYDLFVSMEVVDGSTRRRAQRRVLDISEHGMGFQVASSREAAPYRAGVFIRKMEVMIEGRQIFFDGRVANVLKIENDPRRAGVKVGIEIIRMSPVDRQFVAAYVARNLVQFYT
jgi:c-di-GMP-binding flagellar brake protein YcgR